MTRSVLLLALLISFGNCARAQSLAGERNLDRAITLQFGYGPMWAGGDLGDRFGQGFSIDGGLALMPDEKPYEFGIRVQFGFGNDLKEDILANLRTEQGFLIGNQREPADIQLRQRQLFIGPSFGYTFAFGENKRAGIQTRTSVGYFYHRIKVQRDVVQGVAALNEEYLPGYDRLAGGPALYQFVGYQQLGVNRTLNFYVGAEVTAGFTNNLRLFDIPSRSVPSTDGRTDLVFGLKAGIIIPLYLGDGEEIFYR